MAFFCVKRDTKYLVVLSRYSLVFRIWTFLKDKCVKLGTFYNILILDFLLLEWGLWIWNTDLKTESRIQIRQRDWKNPEPTPKGPTLGQAPLKIK